MLSGKTVVFGVCGGIAAYKAVDVVSRLKKNNASVNVIMTENAQKFVTPLTFQAISHNAVNADMFAVPESWDIEHISLAKKADLIVIAPATANIIGKIANGLADDMLTTTVMATKAPVLIVPAMNYNMYENPIVQKNISTLTNLGYLFMEPEIGMMAEGTSGKGRLPEPAAIVEKVIEIFNQKKNMKGVKLLVTAGPTREELDPVRFVSNKSSGKMGYAIAQNAKDRGADVVLISGPVDIPAPDGVKYIDITSADQMYKAVQQYIETVDAIILSAAVADFRSASVSPNKLKKKDGVPKIELEKNPDIAYEIGKNKGSRVHVGFSAETENLIENASEKLKSKNFDMIAANDVTMEGAGFGTDTNIMKLIVNDGRTVDIPLMSKYEAAGIILDEVTKMLADRKSKGETY